MSMITRYEFPLIKVVDGKGTFLAKNELLSKEEVTMRLYDDGGEIGIIRATSLKNNTLKVFCYSKTADFSEKNIITAYICDRLNNMYNFNGPIDVRKKDSDEVDMNFEIWHIAEVRREKGCGYKKMKEETIDSIEKTLVEFHRLRESIRLLPLEKTNIIKLADMYSNLVDSAKNFGYRNL